MSFQSTSIKSISDPNILADRMMKTRPVTHEPNREGHKDMTLCDILRAGCGLLQTDEDAHQLLAYCIKSAFRSARRKQRQNGQADL